MLRQGQAGFVDRHQRRPLRRHQHRRRRPRLEVQVLHELRQVPVGPVADLRAGTNRAGTFKPDLLPVSPQHKSVDRVYHNK